MLPDGHRPFPDRDEFELFASMTPAREVGGDFYDFFLVDDDHLALVIADVSGKGVPAALFMVIARTLIRNAAQHGRTPAEIFSGKGLATNAGHEHPAIRRAGGEWELTVYRHSPMLAAMDEMSFEEHGFTLGPGDSLFVYTDGVPEATNADGELFGTERMVRALKKSGC